MNSLFCLTHVFLETFRHRKKIFFAVFFIVLVPLVLSVQKIPKRYQSTALFNFHSDFSKIPASSEFFAEIYDPNEIRAEKEAILLAVLSDDFLFDLAEKNLGHAAAQQEWLVQGLRKDVRFVPLSRTTYQLVVLQRSPSIAQKIAWKVMERLEESLRAERLARMQSVYDSVSQQLSELAIDGQDKNLAMDIRAARLRVESEIRKLESLYTAEHPKLARLRTQLQNLQKPAESDVMRGPLERGQVENWASLRGILLTRQALLQVAIRMEEKGAIAHIKIVKEPDEPLWPVEPKRNILFISAAVTAAVVATAVSAGCSLASDLHVFFPNLLTAWRNFRSKVALHRSSNRPEKGN